MEQDQKYVFRKVLITGRGGQAVVEYILLLIIIVSLVLGAKKLFQNVNNFMASYIGDYVACLMEYGELPSLGVDESSLKKHVGGGAGGKVCASKFEKFTVTGGVPAIGGTGGGSTAGGRNGRNSGDSGNSNSSDSKNSSQNASKDGKSKSSGGKDSESSRQARGSGSRSPYDSGRIKRSSGASGTADGSVGGDSKTRILEEDEARRSARNRRKGRNRSTRYTYDRSKYRGISGAMAADIEKSLPRQPRGPTTSVRTVAEDGSMLGPYKKTFNPPERRPDAQAPEDNSGFGFGKILKWLLIAGMVIAIIIFFGGQLLNYSNSQD